MGLEASYKRLLALIEQKFKAALLKDIKTTVIPQIVANLMKVYDKELLVKEPGYDPARPSVARMAFKESVFKGLSQSLQASSGGFSIGTGDIRELGYEEHSESHLKSLGKHPPVLSWLIFYLEGFIGEFAFITEETYRKFAAKGIIAQSSVDKFSSWGWYGHGFLISRQAYIKKGLDKAVPFDKVRHPFSGSHPVKVFERAMDGIDFLSVAQNAMKTALKEL